MWVEVGVSPVCQRDQWEVEGVVGFLKGGRETMRRRTRGEEGTVFTTKLCRGRETEMTTCHLRENKMYT